MAKPENIGIGTCYSLSLNKGDPELIQRLFYLTAVVICAVMGSISCSKKDTPATSSTATPITVVSATTASLSSTEIAIGSLSSLSTPIVRAETSGRIVKLYADVGQEVHQGQLLAEIDPTDNRHTVTTTTAQTAQLKAQLDFQRLTVKRMRQLIKTGVITRANLDEAEAKLQVLAAQVKGANAQTNNAEYQLKRTHIIAPIDSQIQSRTVSEGDYITTGAPVFDLVTLQQLRATLPFPETVRAQLKVGQAVQLTTPALSNSVIHSTVKRLTPLLDPANRSIAAIIEFTNPGGWQPGASVTGRVIVNTNPAALMVPLESVVTRPKGYVVYRIKDHRASEQPVTIGKVQGNLIEITQGINAGDLIAKDGAGYLTDQAVVVIKK